VGSQAGEIEVGGDRSIDGLSCGVGNNVICSSLDYAIYASLNRNEINPRINVVGDASLLQSVDIGGVKKLLLLW
jgi:hypothetical protein